MNRNPNTDRITGRVQLIRTDAGMWVNADLSTEVNSNCSRCAKQYNQPVDLLIDEEAISNPQGTVKNQDQLQIDDKHILDLTEAIRQYCTLSIPMKPICSENCKGLCLTCSCDLNVNSCQCDQYLEGSQWAKLAGIAEYINASGNEAN